MFKAKPIIVFKDGINFIFGKKEVFWVIIHLEDGRKIGGKFDKDSFASSYPEEEQIYLEEVWKLDEEGKFIEPIERSKGIIILTNKVLFIEFFITGVTNWFFDRLL